MLTVFERLLAACTATCIGHAEEDAVERAPVIERLPTDAENGPCEGAQEPDTGHAAAEAKVEVPTEKVEIDNVDFGLRRETSSSRDPSPNAMRLTEKLGVREVLYDFVALFEKSEVSGAAQASASGSASTGGVTKPALFAHPTPTETARITYVLTLPDVADNEKLFLHFSTGLRDGIVFDDAKRKPSGVRFGIEIDEERCFETVSSECRWEEHAVELTEYAGKELGIAFLTSCNVAGNSNYAWAVWGKPRLLKLTQRPLRKAKGDEEPAFYGCTALAQFVDKSQRLFEFSTDVSTPASQVAAEIRAQIMQSDAESLLLQALTLFAAQPKLEIVSLGPTAAVVTADEDFEVQCTVRNTGDVPLGKTDTARVTLNGVRLGRGRPTQTIKSVEPGEETTVFWIVRRSSHSLRVSISLRHQTSGAAVHQNAADRIEVRPALPKLASKVTKELHTYSQDGHLVMGNQHLRIVFVRNSSGGFEYYALFVAKAGTYQQVAVCPAFSEVTYTDSLEDALKVEIDNVDFGLRKRTSESLNNHSVRNAIDRKFRFTPLRYQVGGNNRGESIVSLLGEHTDADSVTWRYRSEWILGANATRLKNEACLEVSEERELLAFHGPMLCASRQERNREKKTAALFPGLEFLEGTERSSNPRDAAPPHDNRLVPHPYKITVPAMAVEIEKTVVGIIWNPLAQWDGDNHSLSAIFASPNWHNSQKNTLMGVFLPTVPEWVAENQTVAATPYPLKPARPISIKTELIVAGNASVLDAITHWCDAYGAPEPLEWPRSDEEELMLSRHGFMHTTWDAETQKSRHCIGWQAQNEPGVGTLLWYDYLATQDENVKQRVAHILTSTREESGAGSLAARGSCHILKWEFPFYVGYLEAALDYMKTETLRLVSEQETDGSWQWHPSSDKTATLGKAGDAVLGTCASSALTLLRHARITGDATSREAGLEALAFMKQFTVPRGAQLWECPMYQPDLLAAAHALGAYVEAYQITNDKAYLKRAEYWAKAGLPFLYHWHLPERRSMHFASIPVFGTTFYTHPWFGVPVQWNGLVFAYYLQHFSQVKNVPSASSQNSAPWKKIAEGITVSAMYQQWTEGQRKGTYPDALYEFCSERRGPHLNPEDIMVNVYTLRGLDPGVKTVIAGNVHISSGAKVEGVNRAKNGTLTWSLSYAEDETSWTLIAGYGRPPQGIRARSLDIETELPAVKSLEEESGDTGSGWLYLAEKDTLLIKHLHPTADVQFEFYV